MVGYYDYVLALIPITLLGVAALLIWSGAGTTVAAPVAGGSAALLVGHALFVNGPVPASPAGGDAVRSPPVSAD